MDWGTSLAVLLGGAVTIAAQAVQTYWGNRGEVRRRSDQAAEDLRTAVAELRREAHREPDSDCVSDELEERMTVDYLPRLHAATGYLARRRVREEVSELVVWLDRWVPIRNLAGYRPGRARWLILARMDELLAADRRHQVRLPKQWDFEAEFRDAIKLDEEAQRDFENARAAERARRAAARE